MSMERDCRSILVVEDDEDIAETLRELLDEEGYHVLMAGDGREALDVLDREPSPCLILLDLFMPRMDGRQFLDQLDRTRKELAAAVPIVLVTAAGDAATSGIALRAHDLLRKPIDLEQLLSTVARFCPPVRKTGSG